MSPLLGLTLQPPSTGNSQVPSSKISSCSVLFTADLLTSVCYCFLLNRRNLGFHTSETQEAKRYCSATNDRPTYPSWDRDPFIFNSLSKTTTLPEYFGFSLSHRLPNTALSNTARGVCSGATAPYCRCQKRKKQLISEKKRHARDVQRKRTDVWGG